MTGAVYPVKRDTRHGGRLTPFQGQWPKVPESALIFHGAQIVGDVTLGEDVSVWHNVVIRGDVNHVTIGEKTNVQDGSVIHVSTHTYPTAIGAHVLIGHMVMLHGCTIEDYTFIGMGAMVMDNSRIETDGMLAAGAMLTPGKVVKSGELWAGRPAKFMRRLTKAEIEKNRAMAGHYHRLALQHDADSRGEKCAVPYPPLSKNQGADD